jgi:hypothetical protein
MREQPPQQLKVGRDENAQVLAVLEKDLLDAPRDHQSNPGLAQRERGRLARRAAAEAVASDQHLEAPRRYFARRNDVAGQPHQAIASQPLVEVIAGPSRGDLVGGHAVPERVSAFEIGQLVSAFELPAHELRALGEHEHSPGQNEFLSHALVSPAACGEA